MSYTEHNETNLITIRLCNINFESMNNWRGLFNICATKEVCTLTQRFYQQRYIVCVSRQPGCRQKKNGRVYLGDIYRIVKLTYVCLSWKRKRRRARANDTLRDGSRAQDPTSLEVLSEDQWINADQPHRSCLIVHFLRSPIWTAIERAALRNFLNILRVLLTGRIVGLSMWSF